MTGWDVTTRHIIYTDEFNRRHAMVTTTNPFGHAVRDEIETMIIARRLMAMREAAEENTTEWISADLALADLLQGEP